MARAGRARGASRAAKARAHASAINDATVRYWAGYMARSTWSRYLRYVWDRVDADGVRRRVERLVHPSLHKRRRDR